MTSRKTYSLRLHLLAVLFFTLLAFLILNSLWFNTGIKVAGYDYFNYHWNFWWIRHALTTPGLNVYETNYVMAPFVNNFGYHALTAFWYPVWALVEPLFGTYFAMNLIITVGCVLNGYLLFVFLLREGVALPLALLGGVVLQVSPVSRYFYYNTHINLMNWFWLPAHLLLWGRTVRAVESGRLRAIALWVLLHAAAIWGMGLSEHQFPIFTAFVLVPYGLYTLWRGKNRVGLIVAGGLTVVIALALLWIAGPLPYMLRFSGELIPGVVEERPGVPFPRGYLSVDPVWWHWNAPTVGGFVTLVVVSALVLSFTKLRRYMPKDRWLWFLVMLPPLLLSMGPQITIFGVEIPMPYRLLHSLTGGMLRMPWRLAPIFIIAGMIFAGKTWTPVFARFTRPRRIFALVGLFALLAVDVRMLQSAPLSPILYPYTFYEQMGAEPYDYVVLEVPTGAGTGEILLGDERVITFQFYGISHEKRMLNGFISRAPLDNFWYIRTDDPMLSWLGQRVYLDAEVVEAQLRERITAWPIGYIVVHQDYIGRDTPTPQEILGYFNTLPDLLCPVWFEHDAVVYRTTWHPDGCPPRTPPEVETGVYQIDLGAVGDEFYIGWGWHRQEMLPGLDVRWAGEYPQADLYADLPSGSYELTFTAQAFYRAREVEVVVNGVSLANITVPVEGFGQFSVGLPAEVIGDGRQVNLRLIYDSVDIPAEISQGGDPRKLAIMVDWVRFTRQS